MQVACGQCIGCRLERSRQWAVRCTHEASMWERNCFITLTYDAEHLPVDWSLRLRDFQLFMKRLRREFGSGIRFFHCGEYGVVCRICRKGRTQCSCPVFVEMKGRPHYHALLFNHDFEDRKLWTIRRDNRLYTSERLQSLWRAGFCSLGAVTFQSAAYVSRYLLKKCTGPASARSYEWVCRETGQVYQRVPEYVTMSRRPGIGSTWLHKFGPTDVWPGDHVVVEGHPSRPPRAYDKQLESLHPREFEQVKRKRAAVNRRFAENQTPARLAVRETCQEARLKRLPRSMDE